MAASGQNTAACPTGLHRFLNAPMGSIDRLAVLRSKRSLKALAWGCLAVAAWLLVPFAVAKLLLAIVGPTNADLRVATGWTLSTTAALFLYIPLRRRFFEAKRSGASRRSRLAAVTLLVVTLPPLLIASYFVTFEVAHWDNLSFGLVLGAASFALSSAVYEEILFRDLLFRGSLTFLPVLPAIGVQLLIFGGPHFLEQRFNFFNLCSIAISTVFYCLLWLRYRSVGPCIAAHFAWNFSLYILHGIFTSALVKAGLFYTGDSPSGILIHSAIILLAILVVSGGLRSVRGQAPADEAVGRSRRGGALS